MLYKKSVILSSMDQSTKKAVVTMKLVNGKVDGDVKLYNFVEEPMGELILGFLVDGSVQHATLSRVGYMQYIFKGNLTQIPASCSCALINSLNEQSDAILLGTIAEKNNVENMLTQNLSLLHEKSVNKLAKQLDECVGKYEDEIEIENEINKVMNQTCNGNCNKCEYKKYFYSAQKENSISNQVEKGITKGQMRVPSQSLSTDFFDEIKEQIEMLFKSYPKEENLEEIIPNSRWVKVDFNNDKKYYVVGLIYQDNKVKYVCYGIPSKWSIEAPSDFNPKAQWLALDLDEPQGEGFWITYQDAQSGELVSVNIV